MEGIEYRHSKVLLDEIPGAYKDIDQVMAAQSDLVEPLARFDPRLVKMAPSGEPPED
jgi:tRNA-splicing ligase RtcB